MHDAIMAASLDQQQNLIVLNSADILEACLEIAATLTATSDPVSTPTKRLEFSKRVGKRYLRLVQAVQDEFDRDGGAPFETLHAGRGH
jgi:hypothetical protein